MTTHIKEDGSAARQVHPHGSGQSVASVTFLDGATQRAKGLPAALRPLAGYLSRLAVGELSIALPSKDSLLIQGPTAGPKAEMHVPRWRVFPRAIFRGDVGLGEAFMDGDWTSGDVATLLHYFAANTLASGEQFTPRGFAGLSLSMLHRIRANSLRRAPKNIAAHYDLGNAFYEAWLDRSMTYSSGLFRAGDTLEQAQRNKNDALIKALSLGPQDHVLEIGCGWGGFACQAAQDTGCRVTAITLSRAQLDYARKRIQDEGLSDRVSVFEMDYRHMDGQFDKIASIEMIEAVGERYWPVYFEKVARLLRPGGRFGVQAITIQDHAFEDYKKTSDFLQTYIFPGGMLLPEEGLQSMARRAELAPLDSLAFGPDYARTLALWQTRFQAAWPEIQKMGFDERFRRMWTFYLATCEAGFRSGLITVSQSVFQKGEATQTEQNGGAGPREHG